MFPRIRTYITLFFVFFCTHALLCACRTTENTLPPKHVQTVSQDEGNRPKMIYPSIGEGVVRKWFKGIRFDSYRFSSLFNEFHPDDGNLVATYKKGSKRLLFVSFIDNKRMSRFGFQRNAQELVSVGAAKKPHTYTLNGKTWYGDDTAAPILAVDVTNEVKVVLMGYKGISLDDLTKLAVPLDIGYLEKAAHQQKL